MMRASRWQPRCLKVQPEWELISAARDGDDVAIRELIRRFNPRLFRIARGIVPSDAEAEEIVQDTYLTAFTRLDEFRGDAKFSTWITRIVLNNAKMHARRRNPEQPYDTVGESDRDGPRVLPFPGQAPDRPEAALGRTQIRGLLEKAVADLPPTLRLPFVMREAEGMSILTIAHDLSLNPVTVKTRLFRARRRLRAAIETQISGGFDEIFPFAGARCSDMAERVVAELRSSASKRK